MLNEIKSEIVLYMPAILTQSLTRNSYPITGGRLGVFVKTFMYITVFGLHAVSELFAQNLMLDFFKILYQMVFVIPERFSRRQITLIYLSFEI